MACLNGISTLNNISYNYLLPILKIANFARYPATGIVSYTIGTILGFCKPELQKITGCYVNSISDCFVQLLAWQKNLLECQVQLIQDLPGMDSVHGERLKKHLSELDKVIQTLQKPKPKTFKQQLIAFAVFPLTILGRILVALLFLWLLILRS